MKITSLHEYLANEENLFAYSLAGILAGLVSCLIIALFKAGFEIPVGFFAPNGSADGFESLPALSRAILPVAGALILGVGFHYFKVGTSRTGLPHTVYVVNKEHSKFPIRSLYAQFFGGIVALASGQSVGQEGPAVHLGAASCAITGQRLGVPSNGLRILAGCGTAAAIAAAFDTPLAGVIFAMEVVLMEYSIASFIPIIMAAVTSTALQRFLGEPPIAELANFNGVINTAELAWLIAMAFTVAVASSAFVRTSQFWLKYKDTPVIARFLIAGIIVGLLSFVCPQIMGTGGDTLYEISHGHIAITTLGLIAIAKIVATGSAVGLGIPGGLIGPSLLIGASVGGFFAAVAAQYFPGFEGVYALYVLLGMAAMMSSAINAPLAAIIFIVELSFSSAILLPGLLVVVLANLFHQSLFKQPSLTKLIFDHQGLNVDQNSVAQSLSHKAVMALMRTKVIASGAASNFQDLSQDYDFALSIEKQPYNLVDLRSENFERKVCRTIPTTASLMEAWQLLQENQHDYLICIRTTRTDTLYIGVLTRQDIVDFLLK